MASSWDREVGVALDWPRVEMLYSSQWSTYSRRGRGEGGREGGREGRGREGV